MAWKTRLARILAAILVAVLGGLASHTLFQAMALVEALLAAVITVSAALSPRTGLGMAVVTAAVAIAQDPWALRLLLGLVLASIAAEALYELVSKPSTGAKRLCDTSCALATAAGLTAAYGGLLASALLGSLLLVRGYEALLSMKLPGALGDFWRLAAQSIAVRIIVYTTMVAIIYWVSSRLVAPLLQALASPGYALHRLLVGEKRAEARRVKSLGTWYHLVLMRASGTLVALIVSPISYPIASEVLVLIRAGSAGPGIRALMTAAFAWLLGIIGYNIGYVAAKALLLGNMGWRRLAIAGAVALAVVMAVAAISSPTPLHYLYAEAVTLIDPRNGGSLADPPCMARIYNYVEGLENYYRSVEQLLRFLVKLVWG